MIPIFIKVRPYVAERLGLDNLRFKTADGNYLLRQTDLLVFGPLFAIEEYAARIGGVVLRDAEAAANFRGELNTPLPVPTDDEWQIPEPEPEEVQPSQEVPNAEDSDSESPESSESTEQSDSFSDTSAEEQHC